MDKHILYVQDIEAIGVYAIHNKKNDKYYIGSSTNIKVRQEMHKTKMMRLDAINSKIKEDLKSFYDLENFEFLILEILPDNTITDMELREREAFYIKKYDAYNGYNDKFPAPTKLSKNNALLKCKKTRKTPQEIPIISEKSNIELVDSLLSFHEHIVENNGKGMVSLMAIIKYYILDRMANGTEK